MSFELIAFFAFALVTVLSAISVITVRNPVHAVLSLILAFFSTACLWLLLQAEFLGIVLVLVYVGAVMILFLFVVMMLDLNVTPLREGFARYFPVAAVVAAVMLTLRRREGTKHQDPSRQVMVRREDRSRLVKRKADARPGEGQ